MGARGNRPPPGGRARRAQRGLASHDRGGRGHGRAPRPLSRVEHAGGGQRAQRTARGGRTHRRAATFFPGRVPAGADAHRGRVSDPRDRGDAGRPGVVHARGPARAAVVAADSRIRGRGSGRRRASAARTSEGSQALERVGGASQQGRRQHGAGVRAHRGLGADPAQLDTAACGRGGCLALRRDRGLDRRGHARPASGAVRPWAPQQRCSYSAARESRRRPLPGCS